MDRHDFHYSYYHQGLDAFVCCPLDDNNLVQFICSNVVCSHERTMSLVVDHRERALIEVLVGVPHAIQTLPVGDIICDYGNDNAWIAERKRADDFANSIKTGRWREQVDRLHMTGKRIFFLIEGDLRSTSLSHESMLGACINAVLRKNSYVIRSVDLNETASIVRHLTKKAGRCPSMPPTLKAPLSKRARDADHATCLLRQIMCIPSFSERIAKKLLEEFKTLPAIQRALMNPDGLNRLKQIRLDQRTGLGKTRIQKLAHYLCEEVNPP